MKGRNKMIYLLFVIYVLLSSSGLILFKLGNSDSSILFSLFGINISLKMILGVLCYGFSFLLWLYIVSKINLTFAMPLSVAIVNTLVVIGSLIFLKEKITPIQGIGIFIVIVGVILVTWGQK